MPGNCKGGSCKGDNNKLLAELKTVRLMQLRVNEDTRAADAARVPAQASGDPSKLDPSLRDSIVSVRDQQADVREAMQGIRDQLAAPEAPEDNEGGKP